MPSLIVVRLLNWAAPTGKQTIGKVKSVTGFGRTIIVLLNTILLQPVLLSEIKVIV